MSKPLSADPSAPSPSHPSLDPALQAALGSLDVQLEAELVRYRRQQAGKSAPPAQSGPPKNHKSLDLIAAGSQEQTAPGMPESLSAPYPITSALNDVDSDPKEGAKTKPAIVPSIHSDAGQSLPIARVLSQLSQTQTVPDAPTNASAEQASPANYLKSSERLLQSLEAEKETPEPDRRSLFGSLLTPVGMGSLLLLLISSAILGYVLMNPASIRHLSWNRLMNTFGLGGTATPETANQVSEPLPTQPNLPGQEFVHLDLNTLSLVEPEGQSGLPAIPPLPSVPTQTASPAASPSPVAAKPAPPVPSLQAPTPAASPATPVPSTTPEVVVSPSPAQPLGVAPSPAPAPSIAAVPTVTLSPEAPEYYYVITDYINDRSLELIQEEVPDAFVSPRFPELNRAPIQAGAFDTEESANRLVEELQRKGIPARVYRP